MSAYICLLGTLFVLSFTGCVSSQATAQGSSPQKTGNVVLETRNNSLSLLYQLLGEERHVSKLLLIKRDRKELADVIKHISTTAADGTKMIEELAKADATLNLKAMALPPGEQAARELQSSATTKDLLQSKGEDFEFKLLMTQAQALGYGISLAKVSAANEPHAQRRQRLEALCTELAQRYDDVIRLLRNPRNSV
jgi:hypothetical protein